SSRNLRLMEYPNKIKKKVLIRKDDSAVMEWSRTLMGSTCLTGKSFLSQFHRIISQLLIIIPKIKIISNEGRWSSLPEVYMRIRSAKIRKNLMFSLVFAMIRKSRNDSTNERTTDARILTPKTPKDFAVSTSGAVK